MGVGCVADTGLFGSEVAAEPERFARSETVRDTDRALTKDGCRKAVEQCSMQYPGATC
jgi:hypothetical protein